jgi:phage shock protein PspC (stress-responsive transcriptional regulator)
VAGVCAAIGRATNTDPVLWRVLTAVLTLFGGVGLLLYLIGWLLIPGEGDTASPMEALVGRGRSATSGIMVVGITIVAVLVFVFVISDGFRAAVLAITAVVAALLFLQRGSGARGPAGVATPYPWPAPPPPPVPPVPPAPVAPPSMAAAPPSAPVVGYPPPVPPPGGYRPPFAPHGPYGGPPVPPPVPTPPGPPKPPKERSRLGRIVLSLMCLALGVVAVTDLAYGRVPVSAYFAVALGVVGVGLLIGAWLGRARWLIFVGLVLAAAVGMSSVAEGMNLKDYRRGQVVYWQPASLAELNATYSLDWGDATLDLRGIDFASATTPVNIDAKVDAGRLTILLPSKVDVDITAKVNAGDANVLDQSWGGIDTSLRRVQDNGPDGVGGGKLILDARVDFGNVEVQR